jgi:hypothetical protein
MSPFVPITARPRLEVYCGLLFAANCLTGGIATPRTNDWKSVVALAPIRKRFWERFVAAQREFIDQCETPICPNGAITAFSTGLPFMEMLDFGQSQVQPVEVQLNLDGLPQT